MVQGLRIHQKSNKKHTLRRVAGALFGVGLVVLAWGVYQWYMNGTTLPIPATVLASSNIDQSPIPQKQVAEYQVPADHPRYIAIPSLSIAQVRIFPVSVTKTGQLDVPKNIHDAAWYTKSALPGSGNGAVLIDAHSGGYGNDGVFSRLSQLHNGQEITLTRGDNTQITYSVVSVVDMPLDEVNKTGMKQMMTSVDPSKEGLSLITCSGKYVPRLGQFDRRIMVRAVATQ